MNNNIIISPYIFPGLFNPEPTKRMPWTEEEDLLLSEVYPDMATKDIAHRMQRSIDSIQMRAVQKGLKKSEAFMLSDKSGRVGNAERLKPYQYEKGHKNPHKGMKQTEFMSQEAIEKCKATHFKKGKIPPCTKPIGFERIKQDRLTDKPYLWRKVAEHSWRMVQYINWEAKYGQIPEDHFLTCKDKNTLNVDADNWVSVTRSEHLQRNSINNYPDDLREAMFALRGFNKSLNHLMKNEQHNGPEADTIRDNTARKGEEADLAGSQGSSGDRTGNCE